MRYKLLFLLLPLLAVTACEKQNSGAGEDTQAPYTLSVDKSTIESDGKDCVVFKLTDANGKVLTDDTSLMSKIYFINEATGKRLARKTKEFRSVEDGTYTFSATFQGDKCDNTVTVSSVNRSKYEVFRKNVALYRFTATWCQNCPSMTSGLDRLDDWTKSHVVELDLHGKESEFEFYDGNKYVADYLYPIFNAQGYPSCVYDLDLMDDTRDYMEIEEIIFGRLANNTTTCGIKATSSYQNGQLTVSAKVKSSTGGKYDIGFAVLKDNCIPTTSGAYEDVYNNVVVAMTGNYLYMSSSRFDLAKDAESGEVSQSITMTVGDKLSEYSVVAYALKDNNGKVVIDNIVELPFNGSVDYVYNK